MKNKLFSPVNYFQTSQLKMTEKVKFSSLHGQNVTLTNSSTTAKWSSSNSGGWAFSAVPLEQGQTVVVDLDGSGHCDLGFIKEDPKFTDMAKNAPPFKQMNEIRIHKRKCIISVSLNDAGTEVSTKFQEKTFSKTLEQGMKLWLTIYIKFGKISVKLLLNGSPENLLKFSDNHGANIILEENNYIATTNLANPASACFVKEKISVGEELVFQCSPILEGGREPSRYHLKLLVYEMNPESLNKDYKFLFDSGTACVNDPPVTTLELLEKNECKGQIVVTLTNNVTVGYRAATSKYNEQSLRATDGIWVILELYRTSVHLSKRKKGKAKTSRSNDVADAVVREPSNVTADNSIDPFDSVLERTELKRQVSSYSEVTDAVQQDGDIKERLSSLERGQEKLQQSIGAIVQSLQHPAFAANNSNISNSAMATRETADRFQGLSLSDRPINVRSYFTQLVKDINCGSLCDKLFEIEKITGSEYQEIKAETIPSDRNRKLLLLIMRKNIMKSTMDRILDETEQGYLKSKF